MTRSVESLRRMIERGESLPGFVFFWSHRPRRRGEIAPACFSQWYRSSFQVEGVGYATAEHYMMAEKARLFDDRLALERILTARSAREAKRLGRLVEGFDGRVWDRRRYDVVVEGNKAKFSQSRRLRLALLETGSKILVEASPLDPVWGIGLRASDPGAGNPFEWRGANMLGFALMDVRDWLENDQSALNPGAGQDR